MAKTDSYPVAVYMCFGGERLSTWPFVRAQPIRTQETIQGSWNKPFNAMTES